MDERIVFAAHLPLPPSANEANGYNSRTGTRFKTDKVTEFRQSILDIITYWPTAANRENFAPYFIMHMDTQAIQEAQWAYKSRSKKALEARKWYKMDIVEVTKEDRRDTDNGHKEFQDAICRALSAFNDKRIINIHRRTVVDPTNHNHAEVVIRETRRDWQSGDLLKWAALELHLEEQYAAPYGAA